MRQLSVVPTYTSEYKASQIFKLVIEKQNKKEMDSMMLLMSIYLIFSINVQPHDIVMQSQKYQLGRADDPKV